MGRRRPLLFFPILFSYRSYKDFANFLFLIQQQSLFPFLLDFSLIIRGEPDIVASPTLFSSPDVFLALGLGLIRCRRRLRGESLPGLLLSLDYYRWSLPPPVLSKRPQILASEEEEKEGLMESPFSSSPIFPCREHLLRPHSYFQRLILPSVFRRRLSWRRLLLTGEEKTIILAEK